nr:hypothetical protein [Tanacetum cinerariifolium]
FILNEFIFSLNHLIIISKIENQCVHLGDFSRIIVGFYLINEIKMPPIHSVIKRGGVYMGSATLVMIKNTMHALDERIK